MGEMTGEPGNGAAHPPREVETLRARLAELELEAGESRRADQALQKERDFVSAVLDTAGVLVIVLDRDGRIVRFNRACERISGYSAAEVAGKRALEFLLAPEEVERISAVFAELRDGQFPNQAENYWVARSGERRLIAWANTALLGHNGVVEYVIGTGIDITDRRRAEQGIRDSDSRLRCILDTVVDAIVTIDERGLVQSFNRAAEQTFGYMADEVIGRSVNLLMPAPYRAEHDGYIGHYLQTGESRVIGRVRELVGQRKDGRTFPIDLAVGETLLGGGRLFVGIVRDITERHHAEQVVREAREALECRVAKRTAELATANEQLRRAVQEQREAERALRASEHRMRSLCTSAPIGIFETDAAGRCTYANERLQEICGLSEAECLGDWWFACLQPEDGKVVLPPASPEAGAEGRLAGMFRLRTPQGAVRWVAVRIAALPSEDGTLTGHVGTVEDMTEHLRAEDEIRARELELAHVARVSTLGEMATTLAHELNQPLAAIANYAIGGMERVRLGRAKMEDLLYALERIAPEAQRAGEIIHTMREFVRKRAPHLALSSLDEMVHNAVRLVEPEARRRGVTIRLDLAEGVPPVLVDRVQIEQVILNLARNGLQAMEQTPPEQRELTVRTFRSDAAAVEVAVQDRGQGLDPESLERLFEPFYTTKPQGMGLGLSICRSVVQMLGGRLWAESQPGAGATFRFVLPVGRGEKDV